MLQESNHRIEMDNGLPTNGSPGLGPINGTNSRVGVIQTEVFRKSNDDDNASFDSSISSLHDNDWAQEQQHSFGSNTKSFAVDDVSSNDSCDSTKSVTKSQSFSTHDHEICCDTEMPQSISTLIAEKVAMLESISWLGRHVPRCVIRDLYSEVLRIRKKEALVYKNQKKAKIKPPDGERDWTPPSVEEGNETYLEMKMPQAETYSAALLFIDMSGFSKLSLMLDLESLSRCINEYFQKIVDEVTNHGGDILKFAGDAVFVEWRVSRKVEIGSEAEKNEIDRCVYDAAVCGAAVVSKCADYPVYSQKENKQISTLNVHCGLAFGKMAGVHVGNDFNRREFLVLGESIDLVTKACEAATYGELMASTEAYEILQRGSRRRHKVGMAPKRLNQPVLIAKRQQCNFEKKKLRIQKVGGSRTKQAPQRQEFSLPFDKMDLTSMNHLKRLLSCYAHPVIVADESTKSLRQSQRNSKVAQERHRAEAELRSVYTIFIKAEVTADLSRDPYKNKETFNLLNDIFREVTSILNRFNGHLRQFIVDDKGVILIATFGLRGSTTPNMASDRVLPASRTIHYALQNDLGVDNYIGTTLGQAYCGVVGSIKRHEYAVLGPSVNLACRLLTMSNHPGILINGDVRREAMKWGSFLSFPPMKAKGYKSLVPVFQPLTAKEARWGKVNPVFVGRKEEIRRVCKLAQEMTLTQSPTKMFFVWGESGSGKSDYLVQTVAWLRKFLVPKKMRVILTRNIGNEGDSLVPFSLFRPIFKDLLAETAVSDNMSAASKGGSIPSLREKDFDALSLSSMSTMNTIKTTSAERLNEICNELGAPRGFIQIVGYHLLGHANTNSIQEKAPKLEEIVDFMATVFIHCTAHADLTVVALDDLHQSDNMSWKVIQKIFEIGTNVLFICGSRPLGSHKLFVDDDFWRVLTTEFKSKKRFQELYIGPLNRVDIAKMASIVLGCKEEEIDKAFVKDIYDHTGGMPHFAFQALTNCKKKGLFVQLDSRRFGWRRGADYEKLDFLSLDELLLQRIDELDDFTRKTLHLASVLGHTFTLLEISGISQYAYSVVDGNRAEHIEKIQSSLDAAVKETILDVVVYPCPTQSKPFGMTANAKLTDKSTHSQVENKDRHYQFCHDTWRQKILSLLLDSYKRDIHMYAASAIEMSIDNIEEADYRTKMRLFSHLKQSGNTYKAAVLALSVGKSFTNLGLNLHSIRVYNAALDMWRRKHGSADEEYIAGIPSSVLEAIEENDLISMIKLLTALGQALATLFRKIESGRAFEDALEIFKNTAVHTEIKDRSFLFPIYSGLFLLLKYGGMIEADQQKAYEQNLVMNYVAETKSHGDPVHYSRALAMQGEFFSRQGQYEEALKCHERLKRVYDVKKHSALVVDFYSTDRSSQNYGNGANCLFRLGRTEEALKVCDFILDNLMPQMDLKNVHNSMIMIYPTLWVLKNQNMPERALDALEKFVFKPFDIYFGDKGKTFSLVMFKPLSTLFNILIYLKEEDKPLDKNYITYALQPNSLEITKVVNNSMANFARCGTSIGAEICLLLSKEVKDETISRQLIRKGWGLAEKAMEVAQSCGEHQTTYFETKPVYDELSLLVQNLQT